MDRRAWRTTVRPRGCKESGTTEQLTLALPQVTEPCRCPTVCDPTDCSSPGCSVHADSTGKNTGVGFHALLQGIFPTQRLNLHCRWILFFFLQVDSLLSEPPGKPKNTGVGSLSLLQGVFLTQKSNQGLPHCRWILYQLSHEGNPRILEWVAYPFPSKSS